MVNEWETKYCGSLEWCEHRSTDFLQRVELNSMIKEKEVNVYKAVNGNKRRDK